MPYSEAAKLQQKLARAMGKEKRTHVHRKGRKGKGKPGRPKNTPSLKTIKRVEVIKEILLSGDTPLGIMWRMANGTDPFDPRRFLAAKECAPYVHPKLQAIHIDANNSGNFTHEEALDLLEIEIGLPEAEQELAEEWEVDDDETRLLEAEEADSYVR